MNKEIPVSLASDISVGKHLTPEQKARIIQRGAYNGKTVRQVMKDMLVNNGMFEEQADEVMKVAERDIDSMNENWGKEADSYPKVIITLTQSHVKRITLKWINENAPEAWFKPLFEQNNQ